MFVSSYTTYIPNNVSDKTTKVNQDREKIEKDSFSSKLSVTSKTSLVQSSENLPIDYVSTNKTLGNKQELAYQQENLENKQETPKKVNSIYTQQVIFNDAISSYNANSQVFPIQKKPQVTLNSIPTINTTQSPKVQEAFTKELQHTMVNTYAQNDKYYQTIAS